MSGFKVIFTDVVRHPATKWDKRTGRPTAWNNGELLPPPTMTFRDEMDYQLWRDDLELGLDRFSENWHVMNIGERMVRHKQHGLVPASFFLTDEEREEIGM